jgi:hypothetical protein
MSPISLSDMYKNWRQPAANGWIGTESGFQIVSRVSRDVYAGTDRLDSTCPPHTKIHSAQAESMLHNLTSWPSAAALDMEERIHKIIRAGKFRRWRVSVGVLSALCHRYATNCCRKTRLILARRQARPRMGRPQTVLSSAASRVQQLDAVRCGTRNGGIYTRSVVVNRCCVGWTVS